MDERVYQFLLRRGMVNERVQILGDLIEHERMVPIRRVGNSWVYEVLSREEEIE